MSVKIITQLGIHRIEMEASNLKDAIKEVSILSELPGACQCGSANIAFKHRETKDKDDYFDLRCTDCGFEWAIGQKKAGGFFPKGPWKAPYQGGGDNQGSSSSQSTNQSARRDDDDEIPF